MLTDFVDWSNIIFFDLISIDLISIDIISLNHFFLTSISLLISLYLFFALFFLVTPLKAAEPTLSFFKTDNVLRVSGAPNRACRHRTQEQLEPPVKTSAGQPRVGRPRSGRKPNPTIPNNQTGRDRYTRWLLEPF